MESNNLVAKSKAKINLFLHIIGKRPNNYHNLESLVCFTEDIYDIIEIEEDENLTLTIKGDFAKELETENNIIIKAAKFLKGDKKLGAKILLTKNLPIASGIGGGSSNAATAIKLLSKLWNIDLTPEFEKNLTLIGADLPCCYFGKTTYFSGIGEVLTPIMQFPSFYLILVNPKKSVSTATIFQNLTPPYTDELSEFPVEFHNLEELIDFLKNQKNDMQNFSEQIMSEIKTIIKEIALQKNCLLSRMTGSGATCFGLFATETDAKNAYLFLKEKFDWWVAYSMVK